MPLSNVIVVASKSIICLCTRSVGAANRIELFSLLTLTVLAAMGEAQTTTEDIFFVQTLMIVVFFAYFFLVYVNVFRQVSCIQLAAHGMGWDPILCA